MTDIAIQQALHDSVLEVLEKMFFLEAQDEPPPAAWPDSAAVLVAINYDGDPPGAFCMSLDRAAAALIAAGFLGDDPEAISAHQVEEVAKELANMICGAVLSRIESRASFRLSVPALAAPESAAFRILPAVVCAVETGAGTLTAGISIQTTVWPPLVKSAS